MRATALSLAGSALLAIGATACGSGKSSSAPQAGPTPARTATTPAPLRSVSVTEIGSLPSGLSAAAIASLPDGRLVLLGGLDESGSSTAGITVVHGTATSSGGMLPEPQHDAQAAALGSNVYVFGGGGTTELSHILRYDPASRAASGVGALPAAASDVGVAAIGGTAYVVGGYDGTNWLDTILAWQPGAGPRPVARLPVGLRYAAVAAAGSRLIIAGGTTPSGTSDAIYSFDPATGRLARIGRVPGGLAHASAATLGGQVLVVGGRLGTSGDRSSAILAIDPGSGAVRRVGVLPQPVSDAAVAASGTHVIVVGGESSAGPVSTILELGSAP